MTEYTPTGFGEEPLETPYENGRVIESDDFDAQDESYAAAERLVDLGVANMADASKMVGYEPEKFEIVTDDELDALFSLPERPLPVRGVSVSLGERATAVTLLLDNIAMQNKLAGAQKSGSVYQRYSNGTQVMDAMQAKAANFKSSQNIAIETLSKTRELQRAGFDNAEIAAARADVQGELSKFTGKGPEANAKRNKEKRKVARTERRSRGESR